MTNFLSNLTNRKRITQCPQCHQKLRVPVKNNTTLRITCPHCQGQFDISFINPLTSLVKGKIKWKSLAQKDKLNLILLAGCLFLLSLMLMGHFLGAPVQSNEPTTQESTFGL